MKAVVMAGGEGTRLRPLTSNRPKPLVPILGKPIAQHIVEHLARAGVTEIVMTLYYLAEEIQNYFGDGSDYGVKLHYFIEETPLGTAGAVKMAEDVLGDGTFLIVSGDALTDLDVEKTTAWHRKKESEATLVLSSVSDPREFGVVIAGEDGRIQRFLEKPSWSEVFSDTVNTGMYVLEPSVFALMERGKSYDWSQDIFPKLLDQQRALYGYVMDDYWCDVGSHDQYRQAQYEMLAGRTRLPIEGEERAGRIFVGAGVKISPEAKLYGPLYLGAGCRIDAGADIGPESVLGGGVAVGPGATVSRSVLWRGVEVGEDAVITAAVACGGVTIGKRAKIEEGAVIGDRCVLGRGATVRASIKLWPDKTIEPKSVVTSSLVWGTTIRQGLFRGTGVHALTNREMTPEFASKLGASFGAFLKPGASVVTARDAHPASRMLKRALVSGLCSVGVSCIDTQALPLPLARMAIRFQNALGGVNVRVDPDDPESTIIEFYNGQGFYITRATERKLETIYFREDYARATPEKVGRIDPAPTTIDAYRQLFLGRLSTKILTERRFKVVVDCAFGTTGSVLPELLGRLGCDVIALNAYADWAREPRDPDARAVQLASLAQVVRTLGADVGALIHSDGERVELVDSTGKPLYGAKLLAVLTRLCVQRHPGARFAVPVSAPSAIERLARAGGGSVVRTQTDPRFLMTLSYLAAEKILMAGDLAGGFIFHGHDDEGGPAFHPTFDGMFALVKTLEMLAFLQTSLEEVSESLPPMHLAARYVECPTDDKGMVMKALTQELSQGPARVELIDGIKVSDADDGWTLIVPDAGPRFVVQAEGQSDAEADERVERWVERIESMVGV